MNFYIFTLHIFKLDFFKFRHYRKYKTVTAFNKKSRK